MFRKAKPHIADKQDLKTTLRRDAELPTSKSDSIMSSKIEPVLSKTLEFQLHFSFYLPYRSHMGRFLEEKLDHFDNDEISMKMESPSLNTKLVSRYLKRGKYLSAYEAFWGTWNPAVATGSEEVYKVAGGNKKPVRATMTAFTYSGLVTHAFNPLVLPFYALEAALGRFIAIPEIMGFITGVYIVLGTPVAIAKGIRNFKKHHRENKTDKIRATML